MFALKYFVEKKLEGHEDMAIIFIDLEKAYVTIQRDDNGNTGVDGVPEAEVRMVEARMGTRRAWCYVDWECQVSGESKENVGLTQGTSLIPLLFIAVVKLISRTICTKDIFRKLLYADAWPVGWGSKSPRTTDTVEAYFQQRWTESTFGEDGGNVGGTLKERALHTPGCELRSLSKETVLSTWVERYVGLAVRQSQKGNTFGVWLGRCRGCSVKKR